MFHHILNSIRDSEMTTVTFKPQKLIDCQVIYNNVRNFDADFNTKCRQNYTV